MLLLTLSLCFVDPCSCFHKHVGVFFGAFLGPIFAVLLFNVVIFIWVIVILVRHTRGKMERSQEKMSSKTAIRLLISISGIMFLFGLTWLFAAFTFQIAGSNVIRTIFQILFTVFSSFQGLFIFLFFVMFNPEARESWREFLSCGRYKSDLLHPSQYKNTSSAGTPKLHKKANTGSTAVSSSLGNTYHTAKFDSDISASPSPLPQKRDLSKNEETKEEIPLTTMSDDTKVPEEGVSTLVPEEGVSTLDDMTLPAEEGVSTLTPPTIVVEGSLDEEDGTAPNWSNDDPNMKARIKRYSTKRNNKHHIEEFEIDFDSGDEHSEV